MFFFSFYVEIHQIHTQLTELRKDEKNMEKNMYDLFFVARLAIPVFIVTIILMLLFLFGQESATRSQVLLRHGPEFTTHPARKRAGSPVSAGDGGGTPVHSCCKLLS